MLTPSTPITIGLATSTRRIRAALDSVQSACRARLISADVAERDGQAWTASFVDIGIPKAHLHRFRVEEWEGIECTAYGYAADATVQITTWTPRGVPRVQFERRRIPTARGTNSRRIYVKGLDDRDPVHSLFAATLRRQYGATVLPCEC